jgi:hypothetical protein
MDLHEEIKIYRERCDVVKKERDHFEEKYMELLVEESSSDYQKSIIESLEAQLETAQVQLKEVNEQLNVIKGSISSKECPDIKIIHKVQEVIDKSLELELEKSRNQIHLLSSVVQQYQSENQDVERLDLRLIKENYHFQQLCKYKDLKIEKLEAEVNYLATKNRILATQNEMLEKNNLKYGLVDHKSKNNRESRQSVRKNKMGNFNRMVKGDIEIFEGSPPDNSSSSDEKIMKDFPYPTSTSIPHSPDKPIQSYIPTSKRAISRPKISAIPPPRPTTAAPTTLTLIDPTKIQIESPSTQNPDMPPIPVLPYKRKSSSRSDSPTEIVKQVDQDENVTLLELVSNLTMEELYTDKDTMEMKQEEMIVQYEDSTKLKNENDVIRKFSKLFKKEKMSVECSDGEEEIKNSPYTDYSPYRRKSEKNNRYGKSDRRIDSDKESSSCDQVSPEGRRAFRRVSSVNTSRRSSNTRRTSTSTRSFDEYPDKKLKTLKNSKNLDLSIVKSTASVKNELHSPRKNSSSKRQQQKIDSGAITGYLSNYMQKEAFVIDAVLDQLFFRND